MTPAVKNELYTLVGGGFDQWTAGLGDAQRTARALRDLVDLTDDAPATGYDWALAATCREPTLSRSCTLPAPEPVKAFETVGGQLFCMSASREGSLIHATVGSFGGVGRRWRNRSGFAA